MGRPPRTVGTGRAQAGRAAWAITPGVFLAGVGGGIVFPILPLAGLKAGLAPAVIRVILAANRLTRVASNPFVGGLVDRFGGKRLVVAGLFVETLVMVLYWVGLTTRAVAPLFLLGRVGWGPASAGIFIGGQTLAPHAGSREHRGLPAGIVRSAQSLGTPSGMVLGGLAAAWLGDANAFLVGAAASLAAALVGLARLPDLRGWYHPAPAGSATSSKASGPTRGCPRAPQLHRLLRRAGPPAGDGGALGARASRRVGPARPIGARRAPDGDAARLRCRGHGIVRPPVGPPAEPGRRVDGGAGALGAGLRPVGVVGERLPPRRQSGAHRAGDGDPQRAAARPPWRPRAGRAPRAGRRQRPTLRGPRGTLGPVAGTTALAAFGARDPYWATAALVLAAMPLGLWLMRSEQRTLRRVGVLRPPAAP